MSDSRLTRPASPASQATALSPAGSMTLHAKTHPVFQTPAYAERLVALPKQGLLPVSTAKLVKTGPLELSGEIAEILDEACNDPERPFALRSRAEQDAISSRLIAALQVRLHETTGTTRIAA